MKTRALDAAIVLLAASLLLILAFGGVDTQLGPTRIRLHDWVRPAVLLGLALAARAWFAPPTVALRASANRLALLALLLAIAGGYLQHHVRVAGGLDSYGYVSAASLLASGRISEPQKLAGLLPFEQASAAAAPLGYVPGPDGRTNVPRFPLGLPLVMALFKIFGSNGPFYVPLLMAFGTMALAYAMGREPGVPAAGLFAAAIVGVDPLMAHYGTQPMSDVPATFWLIAALWLRLEHPRSAITAGFCAGMAILTRPALLPAIIVLGVVTADRRSVREITAFGPMVVAFVAAQMMMNRVLYGSLLASGYGPASHMFEISVTRLGANLTNFGKWLAYSHTAVVWLLWPIALVVLRGRPWAWRVSAVAAAAAAPYLFYIVFDDWESSRFLLPTIVLVLILFARALSVALPHPSHLLLPLLAFLCAFASHRFLEREGVYRFGSVEAKYALVGDWFKTHTSDRAVVLAGLHSGSIRLYGGRETLRWDEIPSDQLRATLRNLEAAGYEPYLALDNPSEPPLFESRFPSGADVALEPIARVRVVNIYRLR